MTARARADAALAELAEALGGEVYHVNYGESEDYMAGFNRAYDDCEAGARSNARALAPKDDPWRHAYLRGYRDGYRCWHEQQEEQE